MKTISMPKFKTDIANKIFDAAVSAAKVDRLKDTLFANWTTVELLRKGVRHSAFYERPFRYSAERFMGLQVVIDHSLQDGEFRIGYKGDIRDGRV